MAEKSVAVIMTIWPMILLLNLWLKRRRENQWIAAMKNDQVRRSEEYWEGRIRALKSKQ